jgi:hypothetical protein
MSELLPGPVGFTAAAATTAAAAITAVAAATGAAAGACVGSFAVATLLLLTSSLTS